MSFAYAMPEKESFLLVEFMYGDPDDPTYSRYTDWQEDYVGGFVSTPTMSVKIPENAGTFDERTCDIELTMDDFVDAASNGITHSPIFVTIQEITRALSGGPQATNLVVFKGRVVTSIRNYQGRSNRVLLKALTIKGRLEIPLALSCNHHCPWTLFDRGCQLNRSSFVIGGTITAIDGKQITTATVGVTSKTGKYWHRGYIEFEGRRIGIQNWDASDPTHLFLVRRAPDIWIGPTLNFVPGCDKTIETCRSRWSNEAHFGGVGFAIPPYNPLLENPS